MNQPSSITVVLSLPRTGSSLVARLLHTACVNMGFDLMPADRFNQGGYYEDMEFVQLNKDILAHLNGNWRTPFEHETILEAKDEFAGRIKALVDWRNLAYRRWGWKDPRTCQTIWLYHPYIPHAKYMVVRRPLADIKASLRRVHTAWDDERLDATVEHYRKCIKDFLEETKAEHMTVYYEYLLNPETRHNQISMLLEFAGARAADYDLDELCKIVEVKDG